MSNSEVQDFKRCRRRWWLRDLRGLKSLRPDLTGARALGDRVHDVLACFYSPGAGDVDRPVVVRALWDYETQCLLERAGEDVYLAKEVADDSDLGRAMLEGYFQWLEESGEDNDYEVIGAEREMAVDFAAVPGVRLTAKLDVRVLRHSNGARLFIDHKTVQTLKDLTKIADIHEQFLHYCLLDLLEHLAAGDHSDATFVDGGVYNMLRKVKRTVRAQPPFYGRHEVRHTRDELRLYYTRLYGVVSEMLRAEARLAAGEDHHAVVYPTPTRDCDWDCEFRRACPMFDRPAEDAEGFLREAFVAGDPYDRYKEVAR
ncbi:MAG TPA: PD-(D/E)XK nuclease family protein [Solirubrobacteraceae bacterium]|nr:PD-(D/E)XK nuclease family protein [Solirubrobacteraceae bacterium]